MAPRRLLRARRRPQRGLMQTVLRENVEQYLGRDSADSESVIGVRREVVVEGLDDRGVQRLGRWRADVQRGQAEALDRSGIAAVPLLARVPEEAVELSGRFGG